MLLAPEPWSDELCVLLFELLVGGMVAAAELVCSRVTIPVRAPVAWVLGALGKVTVSIVGLIFLSESSEHAGREISASKAQLVRRWSACNEKDFPEMRIALSLGHADRKQKRGQWSA